MSEVGRKRKRPALTPAQHRQAVNDTLAWMAAALCLWLWLAYEAGLAGEFVRSASGFLSWAVVVYFLRRLA